MPSPMTTPSASRPFAELDAPFDDLQELEIGSELILEEESANEHVDFGAISNSIAPAYALTSISPPPAELRSTPGARKSPRFARPALIAMAACALIASGVGVWMSNQGPTLAPRALAKNTSSVRLSALGAEVNTSLDAASTGAVANAVTAVGSIKVQSAAAALTASQPKPQAVVPVAQPRVIARFGTDEAKAPVATPAGAAPAVAATDLNLPATPSREDVQKALLSARSTLMACANGRQGRAEITFSVGSSGRVRTATVGGDFAGSPEGSCMARAARSTAFPAFTNESLSVTFPYQL